jgi:hypothetical protein
MTETDKPQFRREGDPAFPVENKEKDNSSASAAGEKTEEEKAAEAAAAGGGGGEAAKPLPFHEDPKVQEYIERQVTERLGKSEAQHQKDLQTLREEFSAARKDNAENTKIPKWFGGNQEQWNEYRADIDARIKGAEDRAIERISQGRQQEDSRVAEATEFFNSELKVIQTDKELNPTGAKVDPNQLLETVMKYQLIDTQGRWNYRAGARILLGGAKPPAPAAAATDPARKNLGAATVKTDRGEPQAKTYKTSADFQKKRPW